MRIGKRPQLLKVRQPSQLIAISCAPSVVKFQCLSDDLSHLARNYFGDALVILGKCISISGVQRQDAYQLARNNKRGAETASGPRRDGPRAFAEIQDRVGIPNRLT